MVSLAITRPPPPQTAPVAQSPSGFAAAPPRARMKSPPARRGGDAESEREREGKKRRDGERETLQSERASEREFAEREREREREREIDRERKTERQRERQRDREGDREREVRSRRRVLFDHGESCIAGLVTPCNAGSDTHRCRAAPLALVQRAVADMVLTAHRPADARG
jgi:hypothetical protein